MKGRVDRLRPLLEEPLLVTNPTNILYLTGFKTSNGALLVEPERVRLFTDFRYAEAARAVEGVEFEQTKRALLRDVSERLSGPIGFEAPSVSYSGYETLSGGTVEPVARVGLVESLRALKDEDELAAIKRACEITDRMFERLASEKFIGRTERDVGWRIQELFQAEGGEGLAFESVVASGPNAARPHSRAGERKIQPGETVIVDTGCTVGGYVSDYTRTFATGPLDGELKEAYASRSLRKRPGWRRSGPASTASTQMQRRAASSRSPSSRERSDMGLATASGSRSTRRLGSRPSRRTCSSRATSSPSSPGSISRGAAGSGSRTTSSSGTAASTTSRTSART